MAKKDERPWWEEYQETMDKKSPPPTTAGLIFNVLMLASPIVGKLVFGDIGLFAGIWIGVIGLVWFFLIRKK